VKSATLTILILVTTVPLLGQVDPPDRVGRVGYISGSVSFQPAGVEDWVAVSPNRPITIGDQLWVDDGSKAEMHVGSTALRLGSRTAFQFLNLDDENTQIRLSTGSLSIHLRFLDDDESVEVDTPNLAFTILRPGDYRIDVRPDDQTTLVTVRDGAGEITGGGQAFSVHPGEQASVTGDQSINYNVYRAPDPDDWDSWCGDRETREERSASLRWVSPRMTGYVDLDENGDWRSSPYGEVWSPRTMPNGWAPYHYGHWAWIDPWGWSWVDDAAWGFAPFHYGRWAYWGNNWVWVPGPVTPRPVYAPALVAWVGGGSLGASMSLGVGAVAWVPLGPREAYVPPYRTSPTYVTQVNNSTTIVNVTNVTIVNYVNARAPNAVVAVSAQTMGSGQYVHEVSRPVPAAALAPAQAMRPPQVAPQAQAVSGHGGASATVPHPPAAVANQAVVVKRPPPPPPVSFASKQKALQSNPGVPLNTEQVQQIRQTAPPSRAIVVKQAPPAAHVVQPVVAARPPQNAIQARPGGQQPSAPTAPVQGNRPVAQPASKPPAQPKFRTPTAPAQVNRPAAPPVSNPPVQPANRPTPAQGTEKVAPPPHQPPPPVQPAYRPPAPAHGTTQPAAVQPPPKQDKKTTRPPADKDKDKEKDKTKEPEKE